MEPTIDIYYGNSLDHESEREFLTRLRADLRKRGHDVLIFANFAPPRRPHQVDFLIVMPTRAVQVELKNLTAPVRGGVNGIWTLYPPGRQPISLKGNPYDQALKAKYAVGDELEFFARRHPGCPKPPGGHYYLFFDCVVCVYPNLLPGSSVPSDKKVSVVGYPELLRALEGPAPAHRLTISDWKSFASHLSLLTERDMTPAKVDPIEALTTVENYLGRFRELLSEGLHELVPLSFVADGKPATGADVTEMVRNGKSIQLIGPSGSGKTHFATHVALMLAQYGMLPIRLLLSAFDGDFDRLLDRAVAAMHAGDAGDLLEAVSELSQRAVLVMDGWNECPEGSRSQLIEGLAAHLLRHQCQILITSQFRVPVPPSIELIEISTSIPSNGERQALLESYGAPLELRQLCAPFSTPHEISIAAECGHELPAAPTRVDLFDSFARRRLSGTKNPASVRRLLRQLARKMCDRLSTSLPLREAARIADESALDFDLPSNAVDEALGSSLLRIEQGILAFSHESVGQLLAAEEFLYRLRRTDTLVEELRRPRNAELRSWVIPLETDNEELRAVIRGLAQHDLLEDCLRGNLGRTAEVVARAEADRLLAEAHSALGDLAVRESPSSLSGYQVTQSRRWSTFESSLLTAIGVVLAEDAFTEQVGDLIDATDAAAAREFGDNWLREAGRYVHSAYAMGLPSEDQPAACWIIHAAQPAGHRVGDDRKGKAIETLAKDMGSTSYARLSVVTALLRFPPVARSARLLPQVLRLAWDSRIYHIRLHALLAARDCALYSQVIGDETRRQLEELLLELETKNVMLSTTLVETLAAYDLLDSLGDVSDVVATIRGLLRAGFSDESNDQAYSVIARQFDEVYGRLYSEALSELDPAESYTLYTMAALGPKAADGWFSDYILHVLVDDPRSEALPAFRRWTTELNPQSHMVQQTVESYLLALVGLAALKIVPPHLRDQSTDDHRAWQALGEIVFWMNRPDIGRDEVARRAAPSWECLQTTLALAAADVIHQIAYSQLVSARHGVVFEDLIRTFPSETKTVAELGLVHEHALTTLFTHTQRDDRKRTLIRTLGQCGDSRSTQILTRLTEDGAVGATAVTAIREINARHGLRSK